MTNAFRAKIAAYTEPLFYNSTGNTEMYKLCVRHLSAAMSAGVAKLSNGYIIPNDVLHIVNEEEETIELVSTKIKLIPLEELA